MRPHTVHSRALALPSAVFLTALLVVCPGCTSKDEGGTGSTAVSLPLAPPSTDVVAYAAVRGLDAALQGAADVAQRVAGPNAVKPMTAAQLKAQVGAILGDPQLAFLDGSKPILVVVLKAASANVIPPAVALIPAKEGAPYVQQLAAMGMQARLADGLLAVAQTPEGLEAAPKARAVYDRIAGAKLPRTGRVFLDADALAGLYGGTLKAGVAQLSSFAGGFGGPAGEDGKAATKTFGSLLKLEVLGLLAILEQSDAIQLDLDWGGKGFDFDLVAAAKPGSELGGFFTKSAALRAPLRSLVPARGSGIVGAAALDPRSLDAFLARLAKDLAADPDAARFLTPETVALFTTMGEYWSGMATFSMSISREGLFLNYDAPLTSAEKFVEVMEKAVRLMSPGSAMGDMYKSMGIETSATFQKEARHHSGVAVSRYKMSTKLEGSAFVPSGTEKEFMKSFLDQEMEVAVAGQRALLSRTPAELDRMIDGALAKEEGAKLELKAIEVFGAGRQAYLDYEIVSVLKTMFASLPDSAPNAAEMKEVAAKLSPTTPMTFAGTFGEARAQLQIRFPIEIIEMFAKLAPR